MMEIIREKTEFDYLVEDYLDKKNLVKALEKDIEPAKQKVIEYMAGHDEMITDFHKVTNKEQIKDGVDIEKLKKLYPEAYRACFKPSIFTVLRAK